jgi:hypothetical protein
MRIFNVIPKKNDCAIEDAQSSIWIDPHPGDIWIRLLQVAYLSTGQRVRGQDRRHVNDEYPSKENY